MVRSIISGVCIFGGGFTVGGAASAFITILKIIPRLLKITETTRYVKIYKTVISTSFILFTILYFSNFHMSLSKFASIPIGLICGIFIGLLSSALAEVLNVIPLLSKKMKIKDNLKYVIWALLLGKVAGSMYFWIFTK